MKQSTTLEYFRIFFETGQSLLAAYSLNETLEQLVGRSVAALGVKAGSLRLVNEETNSLELVASVGLSPAYLAKGALNLDRSIPEVMEGRPVLIGDAVNDPRIQYPEAQAQEGIQTLLSIPVVAREQVIGVLRLYSAEPRQFSPEELELACALAEMGGLAIANSRLKQAAGSKLSTLLEGLGVELPGGGAPTPAAHRGGDFTAVSGDRSLDYFRALHRVTKAILSTLDSQEVMDLIIDQVIALMGCKAAALRLLNETTQELELLACRGLSQAFLTKGPPHGDRSIRATLAGEPVLILDTASDPRLEYPTQTVAEGIASILSLPIIARNRVIGVLRLYSSQQRNYDQAEVACLAAIAEIAGIAIMNARLYEKTRNDLSFWTATLEYMDQP